MKEKTMTDCPDELLLQAATTARTDPQLALAEVDNLLRQHNRDGRLYFLKGSLQAGLRDYKGAIASMGAAVDHAPQFRLARFQLGFLLFTSGDAAGAESAWTPLMADGSADAVALFARGLLQMAHDDFAAASALLKEGIEVNQDNEPLNGDMRLLIAEMLKSPGAPADPEVTSSVEMLLKQYGRKPTRH